MLKNIGSVDRTFRIVVGVILLSIAVMGPKAKWGLLGLIPLITGIVGYCLPYHLLGISTVRKDDQSI